MRALVDAVIKGAPPRRTRLHNWTGDLLARAHDLTQVRIFNDLCPGLVMVNQAMLVRVRGSGNNTV